MRSIPNEINLKQQQEKIISSLSTSPSPPNSLVDSLANLTLQTATSSKC